jgi:Holliday junction resolvase RusA-like endonuclease
VTGRLLDRQPDLVVRVFGEPKTKGSTRSFIPRRGDGSMVTRADGSPMVVTKDDAGDLGKAWLGAVAQAVALEMEAAGFAMVPARAPVALEMIFYRPRKAGHYGTGRNSGVLKDSAPAFPSTKPDVDKLERAILDALKNVAWHDDGQVIAAPAFKAFGTPARVELRLWRLPATVADLRADGGLAGSVPESSVPQSALFAG